jgi:hypothetical protein
LAFAQDINAYYRPPMDDGEVISICKSVWRYEQTGQNRSGHHGAWFPIEEVTALLLEPDTLLLLAFLRAHNRPLAQFMLANGLSKSFGWGDKRLAAARQRLIELGYLEEIRAASRHKAGRFQWAKSKSPFRGGRRGKV